MKATAETPTYEDRIRDILDLSSDVHVATRSDWMLYAMCGQLFNGGLPPDKSPPPCLVFPFYDAPEVFRASLTDNGGDEDYLYLGWVERSGISEGQDGPPPLPASSLHPFMRRVLDHSVYILDLYVITPRPSTREPSRIYIALVESHS